MKDKRRERSAKIWGWIGSLLTVFLTVLVLMSLTLSGLIWTATPPKMVIDQPGFYSSALNGKLRTVHEVLQPESLWVWTVQNELFRFGGNSRPAAILMDAVLHAQVQDTHLGSLTAPTGSLPPRGPFLELNFEGAGITPSILNWMLPLKRGILPEGAHVTAVYLSPTTQKTVYRLTITTGSRSLHAILTGVSLKVARLFTTSDEATPYALIPVGSRVYNLPYTSTVMRVEQWTLQRVEASHVIDSFFADPTLIEAIHTAKRQVLYTDGSRGVFVNAGEFGNELSYTDGSSRLLHVVKTAADSLNSVMTYMNDHGGFVGNQFLSQVVEGVGGAQARFDFADRIDGWTLFGTLDQLTAIVDNGSIIRVKRGLTYLGARFSTHEEKILSGVQLVKRLGDSRLKNVTDISLGYDALHIAPDFIELEPVYRLTHSNQSVEYLNAMNGKPLLKLGV